MTKQTQKATKKAPKSTKPRRAKLGLPWDDKSDAIIRDLRGLTKGVLLLTQAFLERGFIVAHKLQDILNNVTAEKTVLAGLGTLIAGLKARAAAADVDQATIDQIFAGTEDNTAVATALLNNTGGDPTAQVTTTTLPTP